jgi:hypothetical protein
VTASDAQEGSHCIHEMLADQCDLCGARCRQCNRPLHDAISISLGVGPACVAEDPKAQEYLREMAKTPDGHYLQFKPVGEENAKLWTQAFRGLWDVEAHYRHREGGYVIYVRLRPGLQRSVKASRDEGQPEED